MAYLIYKGDFLALKTRRYSIKEEIDQAEVKTFSCIDSTQLTGLCRVYSAEHYFENFALHIITWAEPRIVQCLYLFTLFTRCDFSAKKSPL